VGGEKLKEGDRVIMVDLVENVLLQVGHEMKEWGIKGRTRGVVARVFYLRMISFVIS